MLTDCAEKLMNFTFACLPRHTPSAQSIKNAQLIAHRGAHQNKHGVFENTLGAFQRAQDAGCWGIELDLQSTRDGVLMVHHDPDLIRLWGHQGVIADLNFAALRALEPRIPTLSEVVAQFGKHLHLFIEIKAPFNNQQALVRDLATLEQINDYHLLALEPELFEGLTSFKKETLLLVATHKNSKEFCRVSLATPYGGVLGSYLLLTDQKIQLLTQAHQAYGVGFVDSKNSLYRELNRNIAWIFTNQAVVVAHELQRLRQPS